MTLIVLFIRACILLHSICTLIFICNKFVKGRLNINPNKKDVQILKQIYSNKDKDSDEEDGEICASAICHEPFSVERLHEIARSHCPHGHYFHHSCCITDWMFELPTSPLCVQPLDLLVPGHYITP